MVVSNRNLGAIKVPLGTVPWAAAMKIEEATFKGGKFVEREGTEMMTNGRKVPEILSFIGPPGPDGLGTAKWLPLV